MEPTQPVEQDVPASGQAQAGAPGELAELKTAVQTHGLRAAIWIAVVLLTVVGLRTYRGRRAAAKVDASAMLMSARTVQDLEALVEQYGSTPSAPLALLKLAKVYFDLSNYDLAFNRYTDFLETFPEHEMRGIAELGKLHCLEARGQIQEALEGFEHFLADQPGHFLEAQATFGRGRCLEQAGRKEEARVVYENFIAAHPDSGWTARAEEMLETMEQRAGFQATAASWGASDVGPETFPSFPSWSGGGEPVVAEETAESVIDQPESD